MNEVDLQNAYLGVAYFLTSFGVLLTISWPILYLLLRKEINLFPKEIQNTISTKVRVLMLNVNLDESFLYSNACNNDNSHCLLHFGWFEFWIWTEDEGKTRQLLLVSDLLPGVRVQLRHFLQPRAQTKHKLAPAVAFQLTLQKSDYHCS